jgi:hypothetical protein
MLVVLLAMPAAAQAAPVLDQEQSVTTGHGFLVGTLPLPAEQSVAQTFTAGLTGTLDHVDLFLFHFSGSGPITVEITTVVAGVPSGEVLASTTIAALSVSPYPDFAYATATFAAPASVVAGTQYAIVASSSGAYAWAAASEDVYARGQAYAKQGTAPALPWTPSADLPDMTFRTWVTVAPRLPATAVQCKNGGWRTFEVFKSQGDCVSFVATHGRNAPANPPST